MQEALELDEPLKEPQRKHAIVWIMVKPDTSSAGPETKPKRSRTRPEARGFLVSKTFFSTLEYAAVPNAATDLFVPFIEQLQEEWEDVYKVAEQRLNHMVET